MSLTKKIISRCTACGQWAIFPITFLNVEGKWSRICRKCSMTGLIILSDTFQKCLSLANWVLANKPALEEKDKQINELQWAFHLAQTMRDKNNPLVISNQNFPN